MDFDLPETFDLADVELLGLSSGVGVASFVICTGDSDKHWSDLPHISVFDEVDILELIETAPPSISSTSSASWSSTIPIETEVLVVLKLFQRWNHLNWFGTLLTF